MTFELPELPYKHDALEPYMSARTLKLHHGAHHKA
jgi:Fe-Mn family superoxide dismutase